MSNMLATDHALESSDFELPLTETATQENALSSSANRNAEISIPYLFEPLTQNPECKGPLAIFGDDGDFGSFGTEDTLQIGQDPVFDQGDAGSIGSSDSMLPLLLDEYDSISGLKTLKLKDYQVPVAEKSLRGENDIILLPTGAGKTYIAIKIIIEHLHEYKDDNPKVMFFAPTNVLALQQVQKIQECLSPEWREKCRKVTGDDKVDPDWLIDIIRGDDYSVLVVTPAMISNYFELCPDASLSDFTLLIFDEYHHARQDHYYNRLVLSCMQFRHNAAPGSKTPQLIGLTATIGIGESKNQDQATGYVLDMCAKLGLKSAPSQPSDVAAIMNCPEEEYTNTDFEITNSKQDVFSQFIQNEVMRKLETEIKEKLNSNFLKHYKASLEIKFHDDRLSRSYEKDVVTLRRVGPSLKDIPDEGVQAEVTYCMKALKHLKICYEALQLNELLNCEQASKYIEQKLKHNPDYAYEGLADVYNELLSERFSEQRATKYGQIVSKLINKLGDLLMANSERKIIIFVHARAVAKHLAELLTSHGSELFKAVAFTSDNRSTLEGGTKSKDQISARQGFENGKYNILVSTSVLEEGVDIQACDVVVRYMYIKTMIAKIQSKGRARKQNALLYTILTSRMMTREKENDFKERLMYKAMLEIGEMTSVDFETKMGERQEKLLADADHLQAKRIPDDVPVVPKEGPITCMDCSAELGYISLVRRYCTCHFLVIDPSMHEKVILFPDKNFMPEVDGVKAHAKLLCNATKASGAICKNQVASLVTISGYFFGIWIASKKSEKGVFVNGRKLRQYKEVAKYILPITPEELKEISPQCQFPPEVIKNND